MTEEEARAFLEEAFPAVLPPGGDKPALDRYIAADFIMQGPNYRHTRSEFEQHIAALRAEFSSIEVDFPQVMTDGTRIAEMHNFTGHKKDGTTVRALIQCFIWVEDRKMVRMDTVMQTVGGDEAGNDVTAAR